MAERDLLIDAECTQCGASLNIDLDNLIGFCPYCGQKLLIDPTAFKDVLAEREATKREELRYQHEKEMREAAERAKQKQTKIRLAMAAIGGLCIILGICIPKLALLVLVGANILIWLVALMPKSEGNGEETNSAKPSKPTIVRASKVDSKTSKDLGSVAIRGIAGRVILGPFGALLGLTGKDKTETTFVVEYSDGRKETEVVNNDDDRYRELCKYL